MSIVQRHLEVAQFVGEVVDAEAEQRVVAHRPELTLVGQPFLARRAEHLMHFGHFHVVARKVALHGLHLSPFQSGVRILDFLEVRYVRHVVGEKEVEVRLLRQQGCTAQDEQQMKYE